MLKILPKAALAIIFILSFASTAFAQGASYDPITASNIAPQTLEDTIRGLSMFSVVSASTIVVAFVLLTMLFKNQSDAVKKLMFSGIVVPTVLTTLFLVGSTLILNSTSHTKGPVHWHAAFEIWDCGEQVDLIDPEGFSNKVGTPTLHEHNDKWIHVEGVVVDLEDVSLGSFLRVIGGDISGSESRIPTNDGLLVRRDGDLCSDGSPGTVQVFLYKIKNAQDGQKDNFVYEQTKLENPEEHVLSPFSTIPAGDCVIVEFDTVEKDRTDKICESYEVQRLKGNLYGD